MRLALISMLVLAACHHTPPHKPGDEYLKAINFEGNKHFSKSDLKNGLALHRTKDAGRAPDPYQITQDTDRLRGQYQRDGFLEIDVQPRVDRIQDATTVTYKIEEGVRANILVRITGVPDDPGLYQKVRAQMPQLDGAPFNYQVYDDSKVKVLGAVQDAGYAHAKLIATVDGDLPTHTAVITYAFVAGPKCKFGQTKITGRDLPDDLRDAVQRRLHFEPGQVYSTGAVAKTQRDIYGMQRFSTVEVQPVPGEDQSDVIDMEVAVSESAPHQLTFGGGFGIDPISYEVRGRAGYVVSGWPTPLDTFTLDLRPAYAYLRDGSGFEPRMRALAKIDRMDLFMTHATGTVEVGYTYLAYEAFTEYGPEAQLGYEIPLGTKRLKLKVGYQIQEYQFSHASDLLDQMTIQMLGIDHRELLGAYKASLVMDFRDHPVEPHWGLYGEMNVAIGTKVAGSEYEYQQITPELRAYAPLGPIELAARVRYGNIYGDVPPTERFYAGGASSNRGFSERELSPSVTGVDPMTGGSAITIPYGGAAMLDSSFEARIPITKIKSMPLHGVVFMDGGDVTNSVSELDPSNLNWAAGLGLRLLTVVGPVRTDFGYRLNRTGPDDPEPLSKWAFHLSLGEAF
ncbi:MAG: BamA/TamA family outer membrane protein [Kofleriaceae bacterium]